MILLSLMLLLQILSLSRGWHSPLPWFIISVLKFLSRVAFPAAPGLSTGDLGCTLAGAAVPASPSLGGCGEGWHSSGTQGFYALAD